MSLTYPLVIPIPGQIAFSAVVVSNLLIASSCMSERERDRQRVTLKSNVSNFNQCSTRALLFILGLTD